jgi:hypothetical protein
MNFENCTNFEAYGYAVLVITLSFCHVTIKGNHKLLNILDRIPHIKHTL